MNPTTAESDSSIVPWDQFYGEILENYFQYGDELRGSLSTTKFERLQRVLDMIQALMLGASIKEVLKF